jgi:hypothetical protein
MFTDNKMEDITSDLTINKIPFRVDGKYIIVNKSDYAKLENICLKYVKKVHKHTVFNGKVID